MSQTVSARRYAQAIYDIALERDDVDKWLDDLSVLSNSVRDETFVRFVDSPQIESGKKTSVVKEAFAEVVSELAVNLTCLLASRGAVSSLPDITDAFQEFVDSEKGVERAEIISAVPLTKTQLEAITKNLTLLVGKEISVTTLTDESIIGGFVARVGDRLIDGSVKTRLDDMKRELIKGT